jgi:hypothetical protein
MNKLPKIIIVSLAVAALYTATYSTALALETEDPPQMRVQNTVRTTEIEQLRQEKQEARATVTQERANQFEERREERVENQQERRADFAQQHAERLERRFALYAEHLLNVANRIETRAQMMSKNGKNTTEALAKVTEARSYITSAQTKGAEAVATFRAIDVTTYDTQRAIALDARDLAEASREDFITARDLLREAVKTLVQTQNQDE